MKKCLCGGGYYLSSNINRVDKLYITHVDMEPNGDVFFPEIDPNIWQELGEKS